MKTDEDVQKLEKLIGQMNGLHSELTLLAKKPNDALNLFKMKLVNKVLHDANVGLTRFGGRVVLSNLFRLFAVDDAPSMIGLSMRQLI
jgi:dGTP triphosphohydrolase